MIKFYDRVKETTATTGTGDITLAGAVTQFVSFSSRFAVNGNTFYYTIAGQTGGEWETGRGYLSASTTLVRDKVFESSNADALVNFSAGTKDVFVTISADRMNEIFTQGANIATITGYAYP
jgi:hypothetical protein